MAQTYAPIQLYDLFKSCMIVFLIQAAVVLIAPLISDQTTRFVILFLNVVISAFLGWRLYKRLYHMVFTFDEKGFSIRKGKKEEESHKWSEFSKVSLVRNEQGTLSVRLYENADFFDLPASKLRLNPFHFRLEVMKLVSAGKRKG